MAIFRYNIDEGSWNQGPMYTEDWLYTDCLTTPYGNCQGDSQNAGEDSLIQMGLAHVWLDRVNVGEVAQSHSDHQEPLCLVS